MPNTAASSQRAPSTIPQLQRPQSTPANPLQGLPGQQSLPGFQHVQQHQALHQADATQQIMSQRLAQLQQETRRLHQEMIAIEQRSRAIAAAAQQNLIHNQQQLGQPGTVAPQSMPGSVRNLIAQQQRDRATDGRQGVQDTGGLPSPFGQPQPLSGRASPGMHRPDHTTIYRREGVGPNGERVTITVNEANMTVPIGQPHSHHHHHHPGQPVNQHPALDQIQAILRNADRFLPAQNLQTEHNNMERASSNPLPAPGHSMARVSTPAGAASETPAGTATPATTNNSPTTSVAVDIPNGDIPALPAITQAFNAPIASHGDPIVYLLSSPTGPRALLLNNSDTFYTPRPSSRRRRHDINARPDFEGAVLREPDRNNVPGALGFPEFRNRGQRARRGHRHRQENNPLEPANAAAPHANPGAGALVAQIGPMIWLIVRLIGFVWFFTAGNPSWTRWLMISALAVVVFIINTGIFNSVFEQLWGPVRRHVEALIPLAGPEAAQVPAINAAIPRIPNAAERQAATDEAAGNPGAQAQERRRGEPDPAQVAAHLLDQHRQRNAPGWLMTQIRRAEHAMLLFLASLVPGVGERHIAAREAEANAAEAERQRRIDAAAVAENPAGANGEQASNSVGQEDSNTSTDAGARDAPAGGNDENQESGANQQQNGEGAQAPAQPVAQPLVEI